MGSDGGITSNPKIYLSGQDTRPFWGYDVDDELTIVVKVRIGSKSRNKNVDSTGETAAIYSSVDLEVENIEIVNENMETKLQGKEF